MKLIGNKKGMTTLHTKDGALAVTVIEAGPCVVTQVKTTEKDGYNAVQIGFGDARKLNKPEKMHQKPVDGNFPRLGEFRYNSSESYEIGQKLNVDLFEKGEVVKVVGVSKGRGFSGGVRRHGFSGGPKTHGQSDRWRAPGSIGAGTSPGRTLRGTKMAGQYGNKRISVRGIKIVDVLLDKNLVIVKGAVPGVVGGAVVLEKI